MQPKFLPTIDRLESRDLAAPFGGQIVVVNIPPGIPYRVWVPLFPPVNVAPTNWTPPKQ